MLMSQLHLAMLKVHNQFVDEAWLAGLVDDRVFDEASRQLRWHYQWIVLNEFLSALVGRPLADLVLRKVRDGFVLAVADLYHSNSRMRPIGTVTLRFATATS